MIKRKLDTSRLYFLTKWVVIAITTITGILSINNYWLLSSDKLLHRWQDYCAKNPYPAELEKGGYSCMNVGFENIATVRETFYQVFLITILLPLIFFGGTALFRYLFPVKKQKYLKNS